MSGAASPSRAGFVAVVLLSGSLGLSYGARQAVWQDAVEPSQVLAGVVVYPDLANPFYLYQARVATLLHPLGAAVLRLGFDEITLSTMLSALLGGVCFAAVGVWVWGLSRSVALSLAVAPFLVFLDPRKWGVRYPLSLMDGNTYGVLGLGLVVLALGIVASGRVFPGAFIAGLTPSFHVVLGGWCMLLLAASLASRGTPAARRRTAVRGALLGLALSGAPLCIQLAEAPRPPPIDPGVAAQYVSRFRGDDWHQGPLDPSLPPVTLLLSVAALAAGLLSQADDEDGPLGDMARLLLRMLVVATALGLAFAGTHTLLGRLSPNLFVIAMPCRLLNVPVLAAFLSVIGLLWRARSRALAVINLTVLVGTCLAVRTNGDPDADALILRAGALSSLALLLTLSRRVHSVLKAAAAPLVLLVLDGVFAKADPVTAVAGAVVLACLGSWAVWGRARLVRPQRPLHPLVQGVALLAFVGVGAYAAVSIAVRPPFEFRDWSNDALYARASQGKGFLLASGTVGGYLQRLTRRPMLLDTEQVDALPYVPETGPEIDRIVRRIYGASSFDLPLDERELWRARSVRDWSAIGAEFQVTNVITDSELRLQLPEVARNGSYILYALPR